LVKSIKFVNSFHLVTTFPSRLSKYCQNPVIQSSEDLVAAFTWIWVDHWRSVKGPTSGLWTDPSWKWRIQSGWKWSIKRDKL